MPTYDYRCRKCGHTLAVFQGITEDALTECPECGEHALQRLIGPGAGIIFKGSGFYETDYKRAKSPAKKKDESAEPKSSSKKKKEH